MYFMLKFSLFSIKDTGYFFQVRRRKIMNKLRPIAHKVWKVTRWITGTIIAFLIGYFANLAVLQVQDVSSTTFVYFVNQLFQPISNRIITFSIFLPLILLSLLSCLLVLTENRKEA